MQTFFLIIHVLVAAAVIGLVLLQHGKGADMGAAFGSGSAGSLFGASGSANFLSRMTAVLTAVFFVTSLLLTYLSSSKSGTGSVMSGGLRSTTQPALPASQPSTVPPAVAPGEVDSKTRDIPK